VDVALLAKQAVTTGSARAAGHTGNNNDSKKATLAFASYTAPFKYSIKQGDRNIFALGEMVAAQIRSAAIALHTAIDTALITALNTSKSQVVKELNPYGGTWDATNFIFEVASADEKRFFQRLTGFMAQQWYEDRLYFVHSEGLRQLAQYLIQQGQGNNENLFWQLANVLGYASQRVTDAGYDGSGYVFAEGTVGLVDWIPTLNRTGFGDTFSVGGSYGTIADPLGSGLTFAVHQYAAAADLHATVGERQDIEVQVELSVDIAPVIAPSTTANDSPIFKIGLLEA
jgi:hypothetical protein